MAKISKNQAGLAVGIFFGIMHLLWVILVGTGLAQALANYTHSIHFVTDQHAIGAFSFGTAIIGLVLALITGYVAGWVFALIWDWTEKKLK
jgi:ABC-type sulfate transport system permease component